MTQPKTLQPIDDTTLASLPAFVAAQIQELAGDGIYDTCIYLEFAGILDLLSRPRMRDQINRWIGNYDSCAYFVHLGGSACWMCVGTHTTLLYDLIQPTLLPPEPDPYTWWVIKSEKQLEIYKIGLCRISG